jgi:hypothetical protein
LLNDRLWLPDFAGCHKANQNQTVMNNIIRIISVFVCAFLSGRVFYHGSYSEETINFSRPASTLFPDLKFFLKAISANRLDFFPLVGDHLASRVYLPKIISTVYLGSSDIKNINLIFPFQPKPFPNHLL